MRTVVGDINKHFRQHLTIYLDALAVLCSALLIYLFVQTGLSKILHHAVFRIQMGKQPLPSWSKPILVYALPVIEWSTVLLLLLKRTRLWAFLLAGSLLFAYTIYAYLAYKEVYGYVICACGKVFADMGWREHFHFNAQHTLVALAGFYFVYKSKTLKENNKKE